MKFEKLPVEPADVAAGVERSLPRSAVTLHSTTSPPRSLADLRPGGSWGLVAQRIWRSRSRVTPSLERQREM
jgi:hypothetical protein